MIKKIIFIYFFIFFSSCSYTAKNPKVIKKKEIPSVDYLYKTGISEFENGRLQSSVSFFNSIEKNYNFTKLAPKANLMTAYIYYESNEYIKALEYLKKFKELYPASKYLSYADFLIGICLFEQINVVSKDQEPTLLALKQFKKIIKNYPNSAYADESKIRLNLIYEQLAGKEMYLARYYMKKEKWISAIFRLKLVIEEYQNTIFIEEALFRMAEIYYKIGDLDSAKKYAAILGYNFNQSDWYKKSYKILGDKNYKITNKKNTKSLTDSIKKKILELYSSSNDD